MKKNRKKRILALGITFCLAAALAGCGAENTEETTITTETSAATETTDAETEKSEATQETERETPPEMPEGEWPEGTPPEMPEGGQPGGTPPEMPEGGQHEGPGNAPGGGSSDITFEGVEELSSDTEISDREISSTGTDENAVLVDNGAEVTLSDVTVTRSSDDSTGGDNASFYGVGAAVLAKDGTVLVNGSEITTDASGGTGIFSYGDSTVYVKDTTISTEQGTSGGIHAAGGGTLYAWDLTVETQGGSSAAIRSDRGSGTMVIDGGSYTSNGSGSPAIYSTADISVHGARLEATNSEAICIEGLNSIRLYDCDLTGNMPDDSQNDCTWNVILYQSMSGDSEEGNSTFEMIGGTLTAKNGGMFYTTNTESTFILKDVEITYADENDFFLKATGNANSRGWGSSGSKGADCTFTAISQGMEGNVIWDSISTLDFYITEGSTLTGAVLDDESCAGDGGNGSCSVTIDESSTWIVTADSTLTNLRNAGTIADANGDTVTIVSADGTVLAEGTGSITVTVKSYETEIDLTYASAADTWEDHEVSLPDALK